MKSKSCYVCKVVVSISAAVVAAVVVVVVINVVIVESELVSPSSLLSSHLVTFLLSAF